MVNQPSTIQDSALVHSGRWVTDAGHDRVEERRRHAAAKRLAERHSGWKGLRSPAAVTARRTDKKTGRESRETRYCITSLESDPKGHPCRNARPLARRELSLDVGRSRQIILGEIVYAHYQAGVVDPETLRVDPSRLDAIARLGGSTCSTIRDRFDMPTPTLDAWREDKA